jgi:hypothetical protein
MRHRLLIVLLAIVVAALPACKKKDQPAETGTLGNATDRTPNGTSGTGEPASVATDTRNAATQLDTAGTTRGPVTMTGAEEVHGASTQTTSTIGAPGTTTEAVATPTATTATVSTSTGTKTTTKTKKH